MLKRERPAYILNQLTLQRRVLSTDLSQLIKVSNNTIRRDLHKLSAAKKLIKVHGVDLSCSTHNDFDQHPLFRKCRIFQKHIYSAKPSLIQKPTKESYSFTSLARHSKLYKPVLNRLTVLPMTNYRALFIKQLL
jgi:hypothetical protein